MTAKVTKKSRPKALSIAERNAMPMNSIAAMDAMICAFMFVAPMLDEEEVAMPLLLVIAEGVELITGFAVKPAD